MRKYFKGQNASLGKTLDQFGQDYDPIFNGNPLPGSILQVGNGTANQVNQEPPLEEEEPDIPRRRVRRSHLVVFYDEYAYESTPQPEQDVVNPSWRVLADCFCDRTTFDDDQYPFENFQSCSTSGFRSQTLYGVNGAPFDMTGGNPDDVANCFYRWPGDWFPCETPAEEIPEQTIENLGTLPDRTEYTTFTDRYYFNNGTTLANDFTAWWSAGNPPLLFPGEDVTGYNGGTLWQISNFCQEAWVTVRQNTRDACDSPLPPPAVDTNPFSFDISFVPPSLEEPFGCVGQTVTVSLATTTPAIPPITSINPPDYQPGTNDPEPEEPYVFDPVALRRDFYFYFNGEDPVKFRTLASDQNFEVLALSYLNDALVVVTLRLTSVIDAETPTWDTIESYNVLTGELISVRFTESTQPLQDALEESLNWLYEQMTDHTSPSPLEANITTADVPPDPFFQIPDFGAFPAGEAVGFRIVNSIPNGNTPPESEGEVDFIPLEGFTPKGDLTVVAWSYPGWLL